MTIYYLKQDDSIWGCGDPDCCGEYYEEIGEYFLECACEVEVDADHLHSCNGGGPVLEWREATELETIAYQNGNQEGYSEGSVNGWEFGIKQTEELIINLLEEHVWQLDVGPDGEWKQRCRCGFYGVFNDHLIKLIKGDDPTIDKQSQ